METGLLWHEVVTALHQRDYADVTLEHMLADNAAMQLVKNPGRLVSQRQLLHAVWGPQFDKETNYLRVHLAAIRRKLEPEPSNPVYFVTEHGMGYRFEQQGRRSR